VSRMYNSMARKSIAVIFLASVMLSLAAYSAAQPFERYQTVIDRKPFGPEPVNFNPEAAPGSAGSAAAAGEMTEEQRTAEEQQIAASVRVSMINVTPAGAVAVGFTDNSANPAENYYLVVGRSQNGWTVKSADPVTESVTLEKGGIDVTVKLGETVGGNPKGGVKGNRAGRPMTLRSRGGIPAYSPQTADEASGGAGLGGLARLRRHRAEMRAKAQEAAAKKAEADAVAAAEREERAAREAEEKRLRAEREAREAEERAQQREALRQIQEQLKREREEREAAARQSAEGQEDQGEANNAE